MPLRETDASDTDGLREIGRRRLDRKRGRLLDGVEDDRRARRGDAGDRAQPVAEQPAQRLGVGGADLREKAVLAGDLMDLEHLGDGGDGRGGVRGSGLLVGSDEDEREQRQSDGLRIEAGGVALEDAALLELADPLEDGGGREPDLAGDLGVRRPRV